MSEWISVIQLLPDDNTKVLAYQEDGLMFVGIVNGGQWFERDTTGQFEEPNREVMCWMPLPEAPK